MRRVAVVVGLAGLGLTVLAARAWSDEIYQWTDPNGRLHYSNTPTAAVPSRRLGDLAPKAAEAPGATGLEGAGVDTAGAEALSTEASLKRNALERDLRATEKRLRAVDAQLATLGRARNQNARGSAATGGVGTLAFDVRSEEERGLATERDELGQHVADLHAEAAKLRDELTARLGTTPPWWNDIR
jgi:hypothetical protein